MGVRRLDAFSGARPTFHVKPADSRPPRSSYRRDTSCPGLTVDGREVMKMASHSPTDAMGSRADDGLTWPCRPMAGHLAIGARREPSHHDVERLSVPGPP